MHRKARIPFLFALFLIVCFALLAGASFLNAAEPARGDLQEIWQRVRQSGAYRYDAEVTQVSSPQPSAVNAGRKSKSTTVYMEGETNLKDEAMHLRMWSNGGSALLPDTGIEIKVDGETAAARQGGGAWEDIPDFTGLFAPDGDFMAYGQAAENVVRHEAQIQDTILGEIEVTRYTFEINGRRLAEEMRAEMLAQARSEGLPAGLGLELPRAYAGMSGQGELWVGSDGLPLRQQLTLNYPPDKYDYASSATITVNFSNFAPLNALSGAALLAHMGHALRDMGAAANNPLTAVSFLIVVAMLLMTWLIMSKRSKIIYGSIALAVILSLLSTPLLTARQLMAFNGRQAAKQADQEEQRAEIESQQALEEQLATSSTDPHLNPLTTAQQQESKRPVNSKMALQAAAGSRYFDPICDSDPSGDADSDTLSNLSECLLGTLPSAADTDQDGADDNLEVVGFTWQGKTWYTNPLIADTNNDGIGDGKEWHLDANNDGLPDDTNGDGTPDLWDDDNDGDGVRDNLDLSPYMSSGPNSSAPKTFSDASPMLLTMDNLVSSELTKVEFQLIPTNDKHLRYSQTVLDWPLNDRQGQLQDADGLTFYDTDSTLDPSPSANGDVRLLPMLEIRMPKDSANLPPSETCTRDDGSTYICYPILEEMNITVREVVEGTLAAYVPLQLVEDSVGDAGVAFYGRMLYQAASTWGSAHEVHFVWMVQMLNDICSSYEDNLCSEYSDYNKMQVIQTYEDEWHLSGLHITEEHESNFALIYEDPAVTPGKADKPADYDTPLYVDTLYGLLYGLDNTFMAGRCSAVDANGKCTANSELEITVDTIYERFNHSTNSGVSDTERWNLPNVLSVEKNSYEAYDQGMFDTTVTQTLGILDTAFTSAWSANAPITPTIMIATEQSNRDLNLDQLGLNAENFQWGADNALSVNWANVAEDTTASIKWTPYAYDPATGWNAANINSYIDSLSDELSSVLDPADPYTPTTITMNTVLYSSVFSGDARIVQIDGQNVEAENAETDEGVADLIQPVASFIKETIKLYYEFNEQLKELAEVIENEELVGDGAVRFVQQTVFEEMLEGKGLAITTLQAIAFALELTEFVIADILHDTSSPFAKGIALTVQIVDIYVKTFSVIKQSYKVWNAATTALNAGTATTETEAVAETAADATSLLDASVILTALGIIIAVAVAAGMFIYLAASGRIHPGTPQYAEAAASAVASVILAVALTVIAIIDPIGALIVALISLVDAILKLAGVKWTFLGELQEAITGMLYMHDLVESVDGTTGALNFVLTNPDTGVINGAQVEYSLPITSTYVIDGGQDLYSDQNPNEYNQLNRLIYTLREEEQDTYTILEEGNWHGWGPPYFVFNGYSAHDTAVYTSTLPSGINASPDLILNTYYYLLAQQDMFIFFESKSHEEGSGSVDLSDALVVDVLPDTLDGFIDIGSWDGNKRMGNIDADGDGLIAAHHGGIDPDDTKWDYDGDQLSDGYEMTIRSLPSTKGGVALDVRNPETDGDNVSDNVEMRWGTDPARRDTDGDGLTDDLELAPDGGWLLAYAYDPSTKQSTRTHIWSDPRQADADGDGMNDLFEEAQDTLATTPWADPDTPLIYNPNVWNESPLALYVDDTSTDGFVSPGATIVYTTTTVNNLSSGQSLAGELSLTLSGGASGGPLTQTVDVNSGEQGSLVSSLTFAGTNTTSYELTSQMRLTDFDQTRWAWDPSLPSPTKGRFGQVEYLAVAPANDWQTPFIVAAIEKQKNTGQEAVTVYQVENEGSVTASKTLRNTSPGQTYTGVDVACNDTGACMVLWGTLENSSGNGTIWAARLTDGLTIYLEFVVGSAPGKVSAPSIASNGTDFMATWTATNSAGTQTTVHVTPIPDTTPVQTTKDITTFNSASGAANIDWNGSGYSVIWTGDGNISIADVDTSGNASNINLLGAGGGWPRADGSLGAPAIAHDDISGQTLVAYRSSAGELAARSLTNGAGAEFVLAGTGVDGIGVTVAASADAKNSGWAVAWLPSDGSEVQIRALSPYGGLRGNIGMVDNSALTAVALSCIPPRPLVELKLDEEKDATSFADSSGNNNNAVCAAACPEAGVDGKIGSAVSFNGVNEVLHVNNFSLGPQSFTVSAWVKRNEFNRTQLIASLIDPNYIYFGFYEEGELGCLIGHSYFAGGQVISRGIFVDSAWHHYACTYDKDTTVLTIYQDGEEVASNPAGYSYQGSKNFYLGAFYNQGLFDNWLNGSMDEVLVVDRALSAAEIADVFETAVGVFDLDEAPGSTRFINAEPNGTNGTCSGSTCPALGVEGVAYTAAQFDGVDDFIDLESSGPTPDKTFFWSFENNEAEFWDSDWLLAGATRNGANTRYIQNNYPNKTLALRLNDLPDHDIITISYDLYVIGGNWRGSRTDINGSSSSFNMAVDGNLHRLTDFSNDTTNITGEYQLYPYDYPLQGYPHNGLTLWADGTGQYSGCSGSSYNVGADKDKVSDTPVGDNQISCVTIGTDTAARMYDNTNYGGTNWLIDAGRGQRPAYADNAVSSIRVWPAAYPPKYNSLNETLFSTVNNISDRDTAIYRIEETFPHNHSSLVLGFAGAHTFGLDDVTVDVAKSSSDVSLKNSSFTLSAWAQRDSSGQGHAIISQGSASRDKGLQFGFRADDVFTCAFYDDDLNTTETYTDTGWHHWACTYDTTSGSRTLYRDGQKVAQDTAVANYSGDGSTYFGKLFDNTDFFHGTLDEIGIWPVALDSDQVADLHEKVKVEDESVLTCQLPLAAGDDLILGSTTLRETTTRLGDISQSTTHTITVDADAPTAVIDSVFFSQAQPGPYVSSPGQMVVSGHAADDTSYISQVEIKPDAGWHDADGSETWNYTWNTSALSDGPHTFNLRAYDAVGNQSSETDWYTILDTSPPDTSITAPTGTLRPSQNQDGRWLVPISGTVSDPSAGGQPGSGAAAVEVLLKGGQSLAGLAWQEATINSNGTWSVDYVMPVFDDNGAVLSDPSGSYTINVWAADALDNGTPAGSYTTAPLTLDAAAPEVAPSETLSNTQVINTAMTIGGPLTGAVQTLEINFTPGEQMDSLSDTILLLPMDDNQATQYFHDQSGSNNDVSCTASTCPATGQVGQRDGALGFDGTNDNLMGSAGTVQLSKADFTVAAWVKTTSTGLGVVTKSNGNNQWEKGEKSLYLDGSGVPNFVGFGNSYIHGTTAVNDGQWHHVAVTWDYSSGTSGSGRIYVDGRDDSAATTNYKDQNEDVSGDILRIGAANHGNEAPHFFKGDLDEFVVFQRALADYEVANLYGYAFGTWESATFDSGSWSYDIPDGDNGIEGLFQINVRGIDALGNATPLGGQRVWRGEIDTKPPALTYSFTTDTSGSKDSTTYNCSATDFNLVQDTTCQPGTSPPRPTFGPGNMTLTPYAEVDSWYAATYTDTARLYGLDATLVDTRPVVSNQTMTACDAYNNCTEVGATSLPAVDLDGGGEVLEPSAGTAITSLGPVTVSGDSYADSGLQALFVTANGSPAHSQFWSEGEATESPWSFTWMPPGEGIYLFQPLISDWQSDLVYKSYMPLVPAHRPVQNNQGQRSDNRLNLDEEPLQELLASKTWLQGIEEVNNVYAGMPATIYVDLQPPQVSIAPTILTSAQRIGTEYMNLTGTAGDSVLLHRVDISIDGGSWQRAGLVGDNGWHRYWLVPGLSSMTSDQSFEISARATDVAGRTTTVTEQVIIQAP